MQFCTEESCYRFPSSRKTAPCQFCDKEKSTFYCTNCVRNGDFVHSTSHFSERFAEKRLAVARMQLKKDELTVNANKKLGKLRLREDKVEEIRLRKERICTLQSYLAETKKKLQRKKQNLERLRQFNRTGAEDLRRNEECKVDTIESMNKIMSERPTRANQLSQLQPQLKNLIKCRTDELVKFIFPINEIQSTKHSSLGSDSQEDIKNQLAEATRTAYVRGRWVFTDSWGETQHSIVAPTLPDSGDYSPYIHWVSANKDNAIAMTSSSGVDHNAAFNISAALTYTTQLVNIIAYYLDIRLPNRLSFNEFCMKPLTERKFIKCVTQLNANVLLLCLSQNVDPNLLQPTQTLRNMLLLLNHSDLGRSETTDVGDSCISFLEDQLANHLKTITARLSTSDLEEEDREPVWMENMNADDDEYDTDHIATDWETVPLVTCPEAMPGSNTSRKQGSTQSSIATGLVTSAATSIASIWRGWNNK